MVRKWLRKTWNFGGLLTKPPYKTGWTAGLQGLQARCEDGAGGFFFRNFPGFSGRKTPFCTRKKSGGICPGVSEKKRPDQKLVVCMCLSRQFFWNLVMCSHLGVFFRFFHDVVVFLPSRYQVWGLTKPCFDSGKFISSHIITYHHSGLKLYNHEIIQVSD